ncbi:MAG: ABC transporter substrate-binding protein [Methanothrix sp.]|nr:MAG: ABC transporter substrate-binding protein [Methanothrix sp.]
MNRANVMKIMHYAILAMLFLSLAVLPSAADDAIKEKILNKTADSITVIDEVGRTVTVDLPVKKIISTDYRQMEILLALGAGDMIVGVDSNFHKQMPYFGLKDAAEAGIHAKEVNYEQVLKLQPDLVIVPTRQGASADEISDKLQGVPVLALSLSSRDHIIPETQMMGEILGKEDAANKLIGWTEKYDKIVDERTRALSENDKPTFFFEYMSDLQRKWWAIGPNNPSAGRAADGCGGRNIASDLPLNDTTTTLEVGAEWVFTKNPDYIFMDFMGGDMSGVGKTEDEVKNNLTRLIDERASEGILNFNAVKNNHVYVLNRDFISGPRWVIGHVCIAKWLHPDLFKDLSPDEMNREYLKEFQGMEMKGTWTYPAPK